MDLPVKASEAAALAELIFAHAGSKPLNDDLRNRLAGRAIIHPKPGIRGG